MGKMKAIALIDDAHVIEPGRPSSICLQDRRLERTGGALERANGRGKMRDRALLPRRLRRVDHAFGEFLCGGITLGAFCFP